MSKVLRFAVSTLGFLGFFYCADESMAAGQDPCTGYATAVLVDTVSHQLYLCEKQQTQAFYDVSLGRGGIGKTRKDDNKTPIGIYKLSAARESSDFHTFIPVQYPTPEQKKLGYTGGDIGIHGPPRFMSGYSSFLTSYVDWTRGCIAVAYDQEVDEIAAWLRAHPRTQLYID
jgi:murein L,D-transpeptidase YafK